MTSLTRPAKSGSGSASKTWLRALELIAPIDAQPERTFPILVEELGNKRPDAPALIDNHTTLTFSALARRSRQYSRWAVANDIGHGDVVGLLMPNCPEYVAIWLGISRMGGIVALLNTALPAASLSHCIKAAAPRHLIVAAACLDQIAADPEHLTDPVQIWSYGPNDRQFQRLDEAIETYGAEPLAAPDHGETRLKDCALYIFTSGTTGLPKAARISHHRIMTWTHWFAGLMQTGPDDRLYDCLPMYHSIGGIVCIGAVMVGGGSVFIKERFSVREFWTDIIRHDCTIFQYIGELCRYLTNAPVTAAEARHRLRLCCGNGLALSVWTDFAARFRIPQILEFYAATEANFSLVNVEGKPGSIGRIPPYLAHRFPAMLVQFDPETAAPLRGADGFCMRCQSNQVGEALGRIDDRVVSGASGFEGYASAAETERKIIRNVFAVGDQWFRTGDLMRQDEAGFYYFIDRIGDTFRWKGENVASLEVSEAITRCSGVLGCIVYGVAVAGQEGRAGMCALVTDDSFDLGGFAAQLAALPRYAWPLFVRLLKSLELTPTYKLKKTRLAEEGYDPRRIKDRLYYFERASEAYLTLDEEGFDKIRNGAIRL